MSRATARRSDASPVAALERTFAARSRLRLRRLDRCETTPAQHWVTTARARLRGVLGGRRLRCGTRRDLDPYFRHRRCWRFNTEPVEERKRPSRLNRSGCPYAHLRAVTLLKQISEHLGSLNEVHAHMLVVSADGTPPIRTGCAARQAGRFRYRECTSLRSTTTPCETYTVFHWRFERNFARACR